MVKRRRQSNSSIRIKEHSSLTKPSAAAAAEPPKVQQHDI